MEVKVSWNNKHEDHQNINKNPKTDWEQQIKIHGRNFANKTQTYIYQHYRKLFSYSLIVSALVWLGSGVYIVDQGNRGVVTRFGAYADTTLPGPHWHIPMPIEDVAIVNVEKQRFIELGYHSGGRSSGNRAELADSLMLTRDENIVSVRLAIQYQINNARDYLFNVKGNEATLQQVTESIERGVIGHNDMDFILTEGRSQVVTEIKQAVQQVMDQYQTGLRIASVNLQDAQPPEDVQNAFEDAIRAREDKQRLINEAQAYANEVIPKARGAASRKLLEAEAYEAKVVSKALGESERFDQLLVEYQKAPKITRKRLYLEAKEKLYRNTNKVLVNVENGNTLFYLPINQMQQAVTNNNQSQTSGSKDNKKIVLSSPKARKNRSNIRSSRSKS